MDQTGHEHTDLKLGSSGIERISAGSGRGKKKQDPAGNRQLFRPLPFDHRRDMQQKREDGREPRPSAPRRRHAPSAVFLPCNSPHRRLGVRVPAVGESTRTPSRCCLPSPAPRLRRRRRLPQWLVLVRRGLRVCRREKGSGAPFFGETWRRVTWANGRPDVRVFGQSGASTWIRLTALKELLRAPRQVDLAMQVNGLPAMYSTFGNWHDKTFGFPAAFGQKRS